MNQDFLDLLRAFTDPKVRFLIVGAYALGVHGRPRATGDLDIWVDPTAANAECIMRALDVFGAPVTHVTVDDFSRPGIVFQMGLPPFRIDVLTELSGLTFAEAWLDRTQAAFGPVTVDVIGREAFIAQPRRAVRDAVGLRRLALGVAADAVLCHFLAGDRVEVGPEVGRDRVVGDVGAPRASSCRS